MIISLGDLFHRGPGVQVSLYSAHYLLCLQTKDLESLSNIYVPMEHRCPTEAAPTFLAKNACVREHYALLSFISSMQVRNVHLNHPSFYVSKMASVHTHSILFCS